MIRPLRSTMPFPPMPPPPPAPASGIPAARPLPGKLCAPPSSSPPAAAAGEKKRRPPERPEVLLSSSWPSATLKRPPARRGPGPGPGRTQPPTPARAPLQASPGRAGNAATSATPRLAGSGAAGTTLTGAGAGPDDGMRFSLSLTPEAILVIQRRHLEKQLLARPRRPFPSPSADPRRPPAPGPRARATGLRRGGATSGPEAPLATGPGLRTPPRVQLLPGGLQTPVPGPRPADLRPVLKVSLLNERHKYDDVEYEEETEVVDEGLVRKCTEWLRGVESAAAARDRTGRLDTLPHLSTL
ncbi:Proline-rich protein 18 [Sciurus carolinensis]|uniref:Proline-rich protein 18 n=1 Tax=Sciurus carolinensis TaxID=30640 RepID=A0AA41MLK5_SCICA|nr:Proline-rich protein 18 [Sciurus carolinensis]